MIQGRHACARLGIDPPEWCHIWLTFALQPRRFTIAPSAAGCKRLAGSSAEDNVDAVKNLGKLLGRESLNPLRE